MNRAVRPRAPLYGKVLAHIHAERFAGQFAPAFDWLAARVRESAAHPRLFDLGCGDGRWLAHAANLKIAGEGIDISPFFIEAAQARGVTARQDSAASALPPPGTTAVTALGEVLAYAPAALAPCLRNLSRALPPGGVVLFDLPGPDTPPGDNDLGGPGWRMSVQTRIEGVSLTRRIFIETHAGVERETHHQRLFSPDEALGIARGFGFEATLLDSYGPCPLLPGRFAVMAVRA